MTAVAAAGGGAAGVGVVVYGRCYVMSHVLSFLVTNMNMSGIQNQSVGRLFAQLLGDVPYHLLGHLTMAINYS